MNNFSGEKPSILIIYTGGTIGMVQRPGSGTLAPIQFEHIETEVPELNKFNYNIDAIYCQMNFNHYSYRKNIKKNIQYHYQMFNFFIIITS